MYYSWSGSLYNTNNNNTWLHRVLYSLSSGHDGTVRTWSMCPRGGVPSQEHVLVFQSSGETGCPYPASPAPLDTVVAMPSGRQLISYVGDVINVWSLTGQLILFIINWGLCLSLKCYDAKFSFYLDCLQSSIQIMQRSILLVGQMTNKINNVFYWWILYHFVTIRSYQNYYGVFNCREG